MTKPDNTPGRGPHEGRGPIERGIDPPADRPDANEPALWTPPAEMPPRIVSVSNGNSTLAVDLVKVQGLYLGSAYHPALGGQESRAATKRNLTIQFDGCGEDTSFSLSGDAETIVEAFEMLRDQWKALREWQP